MPHVAPWVAIAVGFVVALICAPAGVSGAFLLLPFQVSVLGFVSPSVSGTNLVYNIMATPGGVARYWRERRLDWSLSGLIAAGTTPGVVVGAVLRVSVFRSPGRFKVFMGAVLLALAAKLVLDLFVLRRADRRERTLRVRQRRSVVAVSVVVGFVGGVYGIGGGSIIAPFLVAVLGLSVYRVAGAALIATFITSVVGVVAFQSLGAIGGFAVARPDWGLGLLFGLGGFVGSYLGAALQKRLPEYWIKAGLAALAGALGINYLMSALRK